MTCLSGTLVTKYSPICCYSCASGQAATFTAQMVPSSSSDAGFYFSQHLNVGYCEFESCTEVVLLAGGRVGQHGREWRADQGRRLTWRLMRVDRGQLRRGRKVKVSSAHWEEIRRHKMFEYELCVSVCCTVLWSKFSPMKLNE